MHQEPAHLITGETLLVPAAQKAFMEFRQQFRTWQAPSMSTTAIPSQGDVHHHHYAGQRPKAYDRKAYDADLAAARGKPNEAELEGVAGAKLTRAEVNSARDGVTKSPLDQQKRELFRESVRADEVQQAYLRGRAKADGKKVPEAGTPDPHPDSNKIATVPTNAAMTDAPRFHGRVIEMDIADVKRFSPRQHEKRVLQFQASAASGEFAADEALLIKAAKGQRPELNKAASTDIAKAIAKDYQDMKAISEAGDRGRYVDVKTKDGGIERGLVVKERDGSLTKQGAWSTFDTQGKQKALAEYQAGLLDGKVIEYQSSGAIARDATYAAGRRDGVERSFNAKGLLEREAQFEGGQALPPKAAEAVAVPARKGPQLR